MALLPLFNTSIEVVKSKLRMSGVPSTNDGQALIEEAIRTVRVEFYRRIPVDRIEYLASLTSDENPTTDEGILRQVAEVIEIKWIRYELLRSLSTLSLDSSASALEAWNDGSVFRGTSVSDREQELRRLMQEIQEKLDVLRGEEEVPDEMDVSVRVAGTTTTQTTVGRSLLGPRGLC